MSPAAAASGNSSPSASAIVADTVTGYHLLKIDGYSFTKDTPNGEELKSGQFTLCGYRWFIRYYPNGNRTDSADYISLYLVLDEAVTKEVKAKSMFSFAENPGSLTSSSSVDTFAKHGSSWGRRQFIKREELEKSKHLKDDSFTIRCDIALIRGYRTETAVSKFVSVPPSDLNLHLGDLLETKKGADVVFEVCGETFAAHRCVLAARSPVFSAELFSMMKEGEAAGVVRIDDMEAEVFKALLCFVYTDSLPVTKTEEEEDVMCQHLLVAADRYILERLKLICTEKLCEYINVGTVVTILELAEQHHCNGLKKACFDFLSSLPNLRAVVAIDGFQHLSRSCPSLMTELIGMSSHLG